MKLSKIALLLITTSLLYPVYSLADDQLDKINVIALRDPTDQSKEQSTINIINKNDLQKMQAVSVADAVSHLANVSINGGARALAQKPAIRGLSDTRVVQVVDGVRQNFELGHRGSYFVPTSMLAQIEVVKGPSSTLWGSGALGGVVATRTLNAFDLLRENEKWGVMLKQGYQSANSLSETSLTLYGITNKFDYLIQGLSNKNSNLRLGGNLGNLPYSGLTQQGGLIKLGWQLNDDQRLDLNARHTVSKQLAPNNNEVFRIYTADDLYNDIVTAYRTGNASAASNLYGSIGGISDLAQQKVSDSSVSLNYLFNPSSNLINGKFTAYLNNTKETETNQRTGVNDFTKYKTLGFNLQNASEFERISLIYGVDFYRDHATTQRETKEHDHDCSGALTLGSCIDVQSAKYRPNPYNATATVWGTYLLSHIKLHEKWTFSPSLRFDSYKTAEKNSNTHYHKNALSPALTLSFDATSWLTLTAKYSEAFRAPSLQEKYVSGFHYGFGGVRTYATTFISNPNLKAETAKNKELSAKFYWDNLWQDNDELHLFATVFQNDVKDFINLEVVERLRGGQPDKFQYRNVDNARLRGIELSGEYKTPRWSAYTSYGALQAKDSLTDEELSGIEKGKLVFGAQYALVPEKFDVGANFSHHFSAKNTNGEKTASYNLVGLTATYAPKAGEWQNLRIDFSIENLFDKEYIAANSLIPGAGRNVKVNLTYQF
ncbi:TonB-dependent hemoglobin/transferrin/lactoferrin family receptor [Gallibacterium salpingitidis]|uniref:TonB-dependent hemoglobin/transferrin/lactoferrin family receptor n=1 Tax=Gallibacterium salpingitidis TaxID=505341 RepID=UPI0026700CDB|nr:TonB-dependent hemoglobin/transferrin/lactoferrin family receptor [Gallibacterium salpingitidis]WKT00778.1 TonB-dependent hemoglobin/transferrin/lactoferrin family receptor [Gallibacterium salpingitidis]